MIVYTRQDERILEALNQKGFYYCKESYINEKMENFSSYYKGLYQWYSQHMEKRISKPLKEIKFPIWVSPDKDFQLQPVKGQVILKLSIDSERVLITDMEKWGYIVNHFYLPYDEADYKKHQQTIKKYGISDPTDLINGDLGNFYPLLKKKVKKSWERLFDAYNLSSSRQGTIWMIKQSDILEILKPKE